MVFSHTHKQKHKERIITAENNTGPLFSSVFSDLFNYIEAAYAPVCPKLLHSTSRNSL